MSTDKYAMDPGVRVLLVDMGLSSANVLRRAGLPADLLTRGPVSLTEADYFGFWAALDAEADDPNLPLRIAKEISVEVFDPPIFAALVSPNLETAAERIAKYKKPIGPMRVEVTSDDAGLSITYHWPTGTNPPKSLVVTELLFWVALGRIGTRHRIEPIRVTAPEPPDDSVAYREYLGVDILARASQTITFAAIDARRPFLTANESIWAAFEPDLRRRLGDLEADATVSERVRSVLLELLPAGESTMEAVAAHLAVSKRTLHRRLTPERARAGTLA